MRTLWRVTTVASCSIAFAFSSLEPKWSENATAYPHGTTTCLDGDNGPGIQLFLKQDSRCEGKVSYPYLEVDVRERPIRKSIKIGPDNWAFRCSNPKESCEQAVSGSVVFDHIEGNLENGTDGKYELGFSHGMSESGRFKVDCTVPCG